MQQMIKEKDIVTTLAGYGSFKILIRALRGTGIIDLLRDPAIAYTLFAPNDQAFKELSGDGTLQRLLKDATALAEVVNFHILPNKVTMAHIDGTIVARTRNGRRLLIDTRGGIHVRKNELDSSLLDAATIIRADIPCANGILHEIDRVLIP